MGSGSWSTNVYSAAASYRRGAGKSAFDYSDRMRGAGRAMKAHPDLDPYGVGLRESRDSDEHPTSQAIAVLFDVTGSMGSVPRDLQAKLPALFGLLLRKGYVEHPQIMFGAIGDAHCDRVPLQVGQFESDNRMDEQLGNIILEGGGGGQVKESYELAMYFMARHTALDCWEKRGRKGYLFIIGDEKPYKTVDRGQVETLTGDLLQGSIPTEKMLAELTETFHVFFIIPAGAYHAHESAVLETWRKLLGERVIELDDLGLACETIALTIGILEDSIDLDEGLDDLRDIGADAAVAPVGKALARMRPGPVDDPRPSTGLGSRPPARLGTGGIGRL
ncbi:hypothetical protein I6A84_26675 [Frankia sp. CNm7]|uniref:Uncharacterized protein n=1 Tax=Frankia nepalensis TaxID=1836974 RepID=A0A937RP92_9ACTN|nr:hypothetical protein [Frankia nepalensis]MBL7495310.1 hypothetical protein [Frankia nepalensis]MBL7508521.1 hypothetical protein [Frankia nepalensis]MBL7521568.1 hypothetical protein [Frankia nepalensis]MBL7632500.1 hypothetical protein [Frankia nepalensis]